MIEAAYLPGHRRRPGASARPGAARRLYRTLSEGERRADGTFAKKPLSDGTVRHIAAAISSSLRWAKKKRLVAVNVATLADLPSTGPKPRKRVWTAEQVKAFLDSTADDRLAALWHSWPSRVAAAVRRSA